MGKKDTSLLKNVTILLFMVICVIVFMTIAVFVRYNKPEASKEATTVQDTLQECNQNSEKSNSAKFSTKSTKPSGNPFVFYDHNGNKHTKKIRCPMCKTINDGKIDCDTCGYHILDSFKRCRNCGATIIDTTYKCPHCKGDKFDHY